VTHFALNPDATSPYKLLVSGELTFTDAANVVHKEQFTDAPANLTGSGSPTAATCDILTLDLGPLHLDLLGLVVDLAPVHLSITAQSGPGNLLGNLLCAVAGSLERPHPRRPVRYAPEPA